ncbi:hypothetical protein [Armatimonas sp.]|uniref:hypothetical protein n=1 Tax=Armatimonas sp. TaxID=1872638 RepID=UPI003750C3B5
MLQQRTLLEPPLRDETEASLKTLRTYERLLWGVLACKGALLLAGAIAVPFLRGQSAGILPYFGSALAALAILTVLTGVVQILIHRKGNQLLLYVASRHGELKTDHVALVLKTLAVTQFIGGLDEKVSVARKQLETTLRGLLPKLNEAQCLALTKAHRSYLRGWAKNRRPEQQVAALLVLATARDTKSTVLAKRFAQETPDSDERVREAATDFLKAMGE